MASVVLGTDEGEEEEVGGYGSDEDTLDEGIIGYIFRAGWSLNCGTGVFTASCERRERWVRVIEASGGRDGLTGFDLSGSGGDHVTQLVSNTREGGPEGGRRNLGQ